MQQIICSTGALIGRPNGRDYRLLKQFCPQLECDGFEFIMYGTWYNEVDAITEFLTSIGLNIPVMHIEKSITEHIARGGEEEEREAFRLFEINCRMAEAIGAQKIVIHLWNGLISDTHFENNLRSYPMFREIAEKHGLTLLVENVVCLMTCLFLNFDKVFQTLTVEYDGLLTNHIHSITKAVSDEGVVGIIRSTDRKPLDFIFCSFQLFYKAFELLLLSKE